MLHFQGTLRCCTVFKNYHTSFEVANHKMGFHPVGPGIEERALVSFHRKC